MRRLLFWLAIIALPAAVIVLIFSSFMLPLFGRRPWVTGADIVWTIVILSAISAWITGIRMRRKIKKVLGREATETDLSSINTWMQVDEELRRKHAANPSVQSTSVVQVSSDPEIDETQFDSVLETSEFTAPASTGLLFPSYPAPGVEIVPTTYGNGWFTYTLTTGILAFFVLQLTEIVGLLNAIWLPRIASLYGASVLLGAIALRNLRLEIRTDGVSYTNVFRRNSFITFAEISSIVSRKQPLGNLIVMPRPETDKPPLKIPLGLFPVAAQEHVMRVLRPDVRDLRD